MIVRFTDLRPNPFRDFTVDPIDGPENDNDETGYVSAVTKLKESVERHGFWGGIVLRPSSTEPGKYEIAAGHHRIEAAKLAGETAAELVVRTLSDEEMIEIYGTENATQRGVMSSALAGTVAAALRKAAMDQTSAGDFTSTAHARTDQAIGRPAIMALIGNVPGMTDNRIKEQLAILKDSGDYRRIVGEVAEEARLARGAAERRAEEARLAREEAERIAEEKRIAKEKADKEAKEAKEEQEHREAEERAAQAVIDQQKADEQAEINRRLAEKAEEQAAEAVAAEEKAQQTKAKADDPKFDQSFDYQGVSKWLHNDNQIRAFRKWCTAPGIKPYLTVESQHLIAKELAEHAHKHGIELSGAFINTKATEMLIGAKSAHKKTVNAEEKRRLANQSLQDKAQHHMGNFARSCRGMMSAGTELSALSKSWPKDLPFPITGEFRTALREAKIVIDKLHKEISINV